MACTSGGRKSVVSEQFPAGLRVLVVDDDVTCLRLLEQMLRKCMYKVTSCSHAMVALNLLRERKDSFDIILSDVHMPDMDGFKLLELVGLEMDLPVIMMSADGRTNIVMRGIQHGACDYLIKPVRDEELKNIWQHVVRKMWNGCKEHDHSGNITDNVCERRAIDDADNAFSASEMADSVLKTLKKRRDIKDNDDTELENDDPTMAKRPRVVWSLELHQQFVGAVNQLGIDKAVPKRILEMMNVPGLTREKVASHLQKFRLYLRRLSGIAQQGGLPSCYDWPIQQNPELSSSLGKFDVQTLAALHAALLPGPEGNLVLSSMNQSSHQHASLEGSKWIPVDRNVVYGKPLIKCSPNIVTRNSQPVVMSNEAAFGINNSMSMSLLQQQQQNQPTLQEPFRSINVVPSCLVLPYHPSFDFQQGNSSVSLDENHVFRNSPVDFKSQLLQPNSSPGVTVSSLSSCSKNAKDVAW